MSATMAQTRWCPPRANRVRRRRPHRENRFAVTEVVVDVGGATSRLRTSFPSGYRNSGLAWALWRTEAASSSAVRSVIFLAAADECAGHLANIFLSIYYITHRHEGDRSARSLHRSPGPRGRYRPKTDHCTNRVTPSSMPERLMHWTVLPVDGSVNAGVPPTLARSLPLEDVQ